MGLFGKKEEEAEKLVVGVNPELVGEVKKKVGKLKKERDELEVENNTLKERVSKVEAKCEAIQDSFNSFKDDIMSEFMKEAEKKLSSEVTKHAGSVKDNHSKILKIENELIKIRKEEDEKEFVSSFQDYYQLIKLCIYMITNAEVENHEFIRLVLQTIHSLVDDMKSNGFWEAGEDAIITSLLNLKGYWRSKNQQIEELIGLEVDALKNLR